MQFINISGSKPPSTAEKRTMRSQAARFAHARLRQRRMREYQAATGGPEAAALNKSTQCTKLVGVALHANKNPFNSFCHTLSAVEGRLFDHYIRVVIPFETRHCQQFTSPQSYRHNITTQWVPAAIGDPGMLSGILLYACRSLHMLTGNDVYYQMALKYKLMCLRLLNETISSATLDAAAIDTTIPRALQLASDELALGDIETCKNHMDAVVRMVKLRGGLSEVISMNGFLRQMVSVFACREQLDTVEPRRQSDVN